MLLILNNRQKLIAFSLVELMISLITISCIVAAFTPVITKKLKKQDIAISIAQSSEIISPCKKEGDKFVQSNNENEDCQLCTSSKCIKCQLECGEDGEYLDSNTCECMSCADKFDNCVKCTKNACTECKGGKNGYILKDGKCEQCKSPKIYAQNNTCSGECSAPSGSYCDENGVLRKCSAKYGTKCNLCDKNTCTLCVNGYYYDTVSGQCKGCDTLDTVDFNGCYRCDVGYCTQCQDNYVLDTTTHKCIAALNNKDDGQVGGKYFIPHCNNYTYKTKPTSPLGGAIYTGNNYKCSICYAGYYLITNTASCTNQQERNSGTACRLCNKIHSACEQCSNDGKCTLCGIGYFVNKNNTCEECNITNCVACTNVNGTKNCAMCKEGYNLSDDKKTCVPAKSIFSCNDYNFMEVNINGKKICITRRNMGDSKTLTIPHTVTIVDAKGMHTEGEYCYSESTKCCWQGDTASLKYTNGTPTGQNCDNNKYGDHSGCNRTVCTWQAANEICSKFTYGGKTWRLPNKDEIKYFEAYSKHLGNQGLQICNSGIVNGMTTCYADSTSSSSVAHCKGGFNNGCYPNMVWAEENSPGYTAYVISASTKVTFGTGASQLDANSVRCVTELE